MDSYSFQYMVLNINDSSVYKWWMIMIAMVQIVSWGESGNLPFNEKKLGWKEYLIFHQMKMSVLSHEWKIFIICFI